MDKAPQPIAEETAKPALVAQPNGRGAIYAGGVPGNNGGRPTQAFVKRMQRLAEEGAQALETAKILQNPEHPQFLDALKWAADRGFGKAPQPLTGADLGPIQTEDVSELQAQLRHRLAHLIPRAE